MGEAERFDLVVIGAGPGGYVAAVRGTQLGMKVCCVDKDAKPGGVCLNVGCIPSKALLDSSEYLHLAREHFREHGVLLSEVKLDLRAMMARKERVVRELTDNVRTLLESNGVHLLRGTARLVGATRVEVTPGAPATGPVLLDSRFILLATGSEPVALPSAPWDGIRILTSTEALSLDSVPERLGVIGAGYIGLELGSLWQRLGSTVTILEAMSRIAPPADAQVGRALERALRKQGLVFRLGTKLIEARPAEEEVKVSIESDGGREDLAFDRLLVAVGRRPLTRGLGLEDVGVAVDSRTGHVRVDAQYRTSVPGIWAVGDLIAGPMLAHKASAEGIAAVECMAGLPGEVDYDCIPSAIYTSPEVAGVGLTEEQAKERSIPYCVGTYPFSGAGRARCLGRADGFAKVLAHGRSGRILGAHILGPRASDLIAECVLAMQVGGSAEDLAGTIHGHPTLSEAVHEAAAAVRRCSIYAPRP